MPHVIPLVLVLVACAAGQAMSFSVFHSPVLTPDTPTYLPRGALQAFPTHPQLWVEPFRTPGYPVFLAIVWAIKGPGSYRTVVGIQTIAVLLANLEVYVIAYRLRRNRWIAVLLASLVAVNLWIVDWEHVIETEALSYWLAVTIFLIFQSYLRSWRWPLIVTVGVLSGVLTLLRPQFELFPAALLLVTAGYVLWTRRGWKTWPGLAASLLAAYILIVGYMAANASLYGYFGLSFVSNVNLFGKVMEYRMQNETTNPAYAALRQQTNAWVAEGKAGDPWSFFVVTYQQYWANNVSELGAYSLDIIEHQPAQYALRTGPDLVATLTSSPTVVTAPAHAGLAAALFWNLARLIESVYLLLPALVVGVALALLRGARGERVFFIVALLISVSYLVLTSAALSYDSFARLRFPLDWAMILAGWLAIIELAGILTASRWALFHVWGGSRKTKEASAENVEESETVPIRATRER